MAEPPLLELPAHLTTCSTPVATTNIGSDSYVLNLAALPGHWAAAASSPSNVICILDKHTLKHVQNLAGDSTAITSLKTINSVAGHSGLALMSSGHGGSVKIWDTRSNSPSIQLINPAIKRAVLCCDISADGFIVAAGTDLEGEDALLMFWDPRQPVAPVRAHSSTHSDDITAVQFAPNTSEHVLLSASSDGLLCTSNADQDDEDEAGLHVGNWGCSISQANWIPSPSQPKIWAASDMETFSTWSDELDRFQSLDIRGPSLHTQHRTWVTDYLITCHTMPNVDPSLGVFVGSNEGDVALLSNSNLTIPGSPWHIHKLWTHGHVGVVRSLVWDEQTQILVTGGEDSKINVWPNVSDDGSSMDVDM